MTSLGAYAIVFIKMILSLVLVICTKNVCST